MGRSGSKPHEMAQGQGHERADFSVARLKSHGHKFEVVVNPDQAIAYKQGQPLDLADVLQAQKVFFDAQKGLIAGETELKTVFATTEPLAVAERIIKEGTIQLTTEYREKLRAAKRTRIIYEIHRNAIDPRTGFPHPLQRVERAIEEAKVRIDEFKSADDQVQEVAAAIRAILPLRFEIVQMEVHLPASVAAGAYHVLKNFGTVLRDSWQGDGSLRATVEMPAGTQQDFYDALNKATHGAAEAKVVSTR